MTIDHAVGRILGVSRAESMTASMGIHWTVVTAMAKATTDDDPNALAAIDRWLAEQREA